MIDCAVCSISFKFYIATTYCERIPCTSTGIVFVTFKTYGCIVFFRNLFNTSISFTLFYNNSDWSSVDIYSICSINFGCYCYCGIFRIFGISCINCQFRIGLIDFDGSFTGTYLMVFIHSRVNSNGVFTICQIRHINLISDSS